MVPAGLERYQGSKSPPRGRAPRSVTLPAGARRLASPGSLRRGRPRGWNSSARRARDSETATATAALIGAIGFAPVAALSWRVSSQALPYAAGSAALELVYLALLARAYQEGELSVVYPVARGSAPLIILGFSVAALGVSPSAPAIVGVCLVGTGVMVLRVALAARPHDFQFALVIAAAIASYTLLDKSGLRHADALPVRRAGGGPPAVVYFLCWLEAGCVGDARGATSRDVRRRGRDLRGFALALAAIKLAPTSAVASVQAVRETSVVIAVVLARLVLGERVSRARLAGATVVLAGVAAIAAGDEASRAPPVSTVVSPSRAPSECLCPIKRSCPCFTRVRPSGEPCLLRSGPGLLQPHDRDFVRLRYADDLTRHRSPRDSDLPEGTVKVRLHRAREKLRKALEEKA